MTGDASVIRPLVRSLFASIIVGASLLGATAAHASAGSKEITYVLTDVEATPTFSCNDFDCSQLTQWAYHQAGVPICSPTDADPCDGTFAWTFNVVRVSSTDPCRMKSGTGVLNVSWADATTTIGTFSFKSRDSKSLSMTGSITGGTNTSLAGAVLKGNVSYTTDLCKAGLVHASISLG